MIKIDFEPDKPEKIFASCSTVEEEHWLKTNQERVLDSFVEKYFIKIDDAKITRWKDYIQFMSDDFFALEKLSGHKFTGEMTMIEKKYLAICRLECTKNLAFTEEIYICLQNHINEMYEAER